MRVRQLDIAKRVGIDVSSVNKILNRCPGPVFSKDTVAKVFKIAREMGYDFDRKNSHYWRRRAEALEASMRKIIPADLALEVATAKTGLTLEEIVAARELL